MEWVMGVLAFDIIQDMIGRTKFAMNVTSFLISFKMSLVCCTGSATSLSVSTESVPSLSSLSMALSTNGLKTGAPFHNQNEDGGIPKDNCPCPPELSLASITT